MVPGVTGSNPASHPIFLTVNTNNITNIVASVAQLDRVSDFGSEGYRFESYRAYHIFSDASLAQLDRAMPF